VTPRTRSVLLWLSVVVFAVLLVWFIAENLVLKGYGGSSGE
jgi:hypothetical protein